MKNSLLALTIAMSIAWPSLWATPENEKDAQLISISCRFAFLGGSAQELILVQDDRFQKIKAPSYAFGESILLVEGIPVSVLSKGAQRDSAPRARLTLPESQNDSIVGYLILFSQNTETDTLQVTLLPDILIGSSTGSCLFVNKTRWPLGLSTGEWDHYLSVNEQKLYSMSSMGPLPISLNKFENGKLKPVYRGSFIGTANKEVVLILEDDKRRGSVSFTRVAAE